MNSLQGRQLFSALAIIGLGIILLGGIVYYVTQKKMLNDEKALISETSIKLITYLNPEEDGKFKTDTEEKNKLLALLTSENLTNVDSNQFAYIQDTKTKNIIWHSNYAFADISLKRFASYKREVFTTFKLDNVLLKKDAVQLLYPETTQGRNKSKLDGSRKYIVYTKRLNNAPYAYQLVIAKSAKPLEKGKTELARIIILLFIITALLVLASQPVSNYLVITPIKEFEKEIHAIESGNQRLIKKQYPKELAAVKGAINALINGEKGQKQRYRDALDDLAHSLKTPLSILHNSAEKINDETIKSQVQRMDDIIAYQLRRAVVSEHGTLVEQQAMRPVLYRIKDSLLKSYRDKPFEFIINVDEYIKCRMEEDDMMEVFGNLINNACRFCERIVEITAVQHGDMVIIDIDDDGMGFPDKNPEELLQRGIRADSQSEGQGIGLAVSTEIVTALGGKIELTISPHVGARVRLHLPT